MDYRDIEAMQTVLETLADFEPADKARILRWVVEREKLVLAEIPQSERRNVNAGSSAAQVQSLQATHGLEGFATVADLMAAVHPKGAAERALIVATFLQYRSGKASLTGYEINKELKHLGHPAANITDTIDALQTAKPALMIQVRKSGSTRQARKQYKVTDAGYRRVSQLLKDGAPDEDS